MARKRIKNVLSKEFVYGLIGIDTSILAKTNNDNWLKFLLTGLLVLVIFFLCFFSIYYGFDLMFHMWHAEILLSSFFSLMFFNIYIFLIQTFSKETLPNIKLNFFGLSNLSRLAFVLLIGFIVAQPIKVFVLRDSLDKDITKYKTSLLKKFSRNNELLYLADLNKLEVEYENYKTIIQTDRVKVQENHLAKEILKIRASVVLANTKAGALINDSSFFVHRIKLSNNYPFGDLILVVILLVFCAPVALIYSISENSKYFIAKKKNDKDLIETEYRNFKEKYLQVFESKFDKTGFHFYEHYQNPPFNTIRKVTPEHLTQEDFFNTFYK